MQIGMRWACWVYKIFLSNAFDQLNSKIVVLFCFLSDLGMHCKLEKLFLKYLEIYFYNYCEYSDFFFFIHFKFWLKKITLIVFLFQELIRFCRLQEDPWVRMRVQVSGSDLIRTRIHILKNYYFIWFLLFLRDKSSFGGKLKLL